MSQHVFSQPILSHRNEADSIFVFLSAWRQMPLGAGTPGGDMSTETHCVPHLGLTVLSSRTVNLLNITSLFFPAGRRLHDMLELSSFSYIVCPDIAEQVSPPLAKFEEK